MENNLIFTQQTVLNQTICRLRQQQNRQWGGLKLKFIKKKIVGI